MHEGVQQLPTPVAPSHKECASDAVRSDAKTTPVSPGFSDLGRKVNQLADLFRGQNNSSHQIDHYNVHDVLGEGGQAIVFLAWDTKLERDVALKIPHVQKLTDQRLLGRLIQEAHSISQLEQHAHIVPIYDAGEANGLPYLVFGYCPGGNLAQWMQEHGPTVPPRTAVSWLCQLAQAAKHAHDHGILHRDIKPNNVYLHQRADNNSDDQGLTLKLGDFGLAKIMDAANDGKGCTVTNDRLGTPGYMAPEQWAGQHHLLSPATDIYALGALLFELLTGKVPYTKATAPWQGIGELPSLRQTCPAASTELEAICHKCLATDPGRRYASAAALHADLQCYLNGEPTSVRPATIWSSAWHYLMKHKSQSILVACVLALVMTVMFLALREDSELTDPKPIKADCNEVWALKFPPKGDFVYVAGDTGGEDPFAKVTEYITVIDVAKRQKIRSFRTAHVAMIKSIAVVDNGEHVITCSFDGTVREYNLKTGEECFPQPIIQLQPVKVEGRMDNRSINAMAVSRDEQWIAVATKDYDGSPTMIVVHNRKTGRQYTLPDAHSSKITQLIFPQVDNPTHLLFTTTTHNQLLRWEFTQDKATTIMKLDQAIESVAFSPNGDRIALAMGNYDIKIYDWPGKQELATLHGHQHDIRKIVYSPNNQWMASVDEKGNVFWWNLTKAKGIESARFNREVQINGLAFSPDGKWLAIGYHNGNVEIFPTSSIPR